MDNICNFTNPNGTKCIKTRIMGSCNCYLKSHYPNSNIYAQTISNISSAFSLVSISKDKFKIYNVDRDGACMYHCFAKFLFNFILDFKELPIINEYIDILKKNKGISKDVMKCSTLLNNFVKSLTDDDFYDSQYDLSFCLQKTLKNWCVKNSNTNIDSFGISLADWILMTHEDITSIEDYDNFYDIFAGDVDYILIQSDEKYKSGKKKGQFKMIKKEIPERWGGITELYAFNKIFKTNIHVYILKKFDQRKGKIVNCTSRSKNARYSLYSKFDTKDSKSKTVNLMLIQSKSPHYNLLL